MIVVGLTGGIGSGKSTVSQRLRERGAVIIDADAITREVQQPGTPVLREIEERFGPDVITSAGELDRAKLAGIVFGDPDALQDLNGIVHPAVGREVMRRMRAHLHDDSIVVLDVALLVEHSRYPIAGVIVVDTPIDVAVARLVEQRGMDEDDARARIARQATREERLARADFVVDNGGELDALAPQIDALWEWIRSQPPVDPADERFAEPPVANTRSSG